VRIGQEEADMASGQALFAEFFTYVLLFEHVTAQGERELSDGQVRRISPRC
jgi:hypothetical protein